MSKFIYFEQFKNRRKESEKRQKGQSLKSVFTFIMYFAFVLWFIIYIMLFFTKGIYLNDYFYKKSPTIKDITYSAVNAEAPVQKIVLVKNIGNTFSLEVDGYYTDGTYEGNSVSFSGMFIEKFGFDPIEIGHLVMQDRETIRGKFYRLIPFIFIILGFGARFYPNKLYSLFKKDTAPGEGYYKKLNIGSFALIAACCALMSFML